MASEDIYISGKWQTGYGKEIQSYNPANGEPIWKGSIASESDTQRAVNAARAAWHDWNALGFDQRTIILQKLETIFEESKDQLASAISLETGKPLWDSQGEVAAMVGKLAISIKAYKDRCKDLNKELSAGCSFTKHRPHGTLAVFGPYNFPGHLPNGHILPALLAGNTIVFKPSENAPFVGKLLTECYEKLDLPPGVFNMVQGGKGVGELLAKSSGVDGLLFTGSFGAGQSLMRQVAENPGKILALELGGNNPLVFDSASNLKAAAYITIVSAFLSSGQRCTCARRLIVPKTSEGDAFIEALTKMTSAISVGPFNQSPEPFMGPLINEGQAIKVLSRQAALLEQGAVSIVPLQQINDQTNLLSPGIMDVTQVKERLDDEIFGPLLQVVRTEDFHSSLIEANQTAFGLSAGILTDNENHWKLFYESIKAGVVNWNTPLTGASSAAPFGGVGKSGNYHPSAYYAADYCAYPVASLANSKAALPENPLPGISIL